MSYDPNWLPEVGSLRVTSEQVKSGQALAWAERLLEGQV